MATFGFGGSDEAVLFEHSTKIDDGNPSAIQSDPSRVSVGKGPIKQVVMQDLR